MRVEEVRSDNILCERPATERGLVYNEAENESGLACDGERVSIKLVKLHHNLQSLLRKSVRFPYQWE